MPHGYTIGKNLGIFVLENKDVDRHHYLCLYILGALGTLISQQVVLLEQGVDTPECPSAFLDQCVLRVSGLCALLCYCGFRNRGAIVRTQPALHCDPRHWSRYAWAGAQENGTVDSGKQA